MTVESLQNLNQIFFYTFYIQKIAFVIYTQKTFPQNPMKFQKTLKKEIPFFNHLIRKLEFLSVHIQARHRFLSTIEYFC